MSRISSQLRFNDLTGGLNNVYSKETLNSTPRKTETPDMVNVEYFKLGGIKTMAGNKKVGLNNYAIQDHAIISGWEYIKEGKKYMMIGLANGEVRVYDERFDRPDYEYNPFVLVYKFKTPTNRMSFCNMNNGVVITNGVDDLVFYEKNRNIRCNGYITTDGSNHISGNFTQFGVDIKVGDGININNSTYYITEIENKTSLYVDRNVTTQDNVTNYKLKLADTSLCNAYLTNTNPDVETGDLMHVPVRGLAIQYYNGRLWVGGKTGLFYSPIGEYNNWDVRSDAGVMYDFYNDASEIKALGLFSEYLMVHREFYTYILTMTGDVTSIAVKPFSNVTCESQQSWIVSNTKYFVYSKEFMDIYPLVQHTVFNDKFLGEPITQKVRNIFKDVPNTLVDNIFCVSRPKERQMLFYLPTSDGNGSNTALIFDFQTKSFLLRKLPNKCNVRCAFNFNNEIYIGTDDGMVLKEFTGNKFTVRSDESITEHRIVFGNKFCNIYLKISDNLRQCPFEVEIDGVKYYSNSQYINIEPPPPDLEKDGEYIGDRMRNKLLYNTQTEHPTTEDANSYIREVYDCDYLYTYTAIDDEENEYDVAVYSGYITTTKANNDFKPPIEVGIEAYYKSPWFDWAGNYYQSFSEFFLECDSNHTNNFIIRTQKDGTSRYEDRDVLENKFIDKQNILIYDDEDRKWDEDRWGRVTFDTLRMLLPNNVFESFQIEFKTDPEKLNQGFHIYQYGFRRIETEEAPW